MDKKFIHIDELVKRKLHHEQDTDGIHDSWAKMEQLLDQSDHNPKPGFWKNGKWLIPILLVCITAGIAGYSWINQPKELSLPAVSHQAHTNVPSKAMEITNDAEAIANPSDHPIYDAAKAAIAAEQATGTSNAKSPIVEQFQSSSSAMSKQTIAKSTKDHILEKVSLKNSDQQLVTATADGKLVPVDKKAVLLASTDKISSPQTLVVKTPVPASLNNIKKEVEKDLQANNIFVDNEDNIVKKKETFVTTSNIIERKVDDPIKQQTSLINDTISVVKYKKVSFIPMSADEIRVLQHMALTRVPNANFSDNLILAKIPMSSIRRTEKSKNDVIAKSLNEQKETSEIVENKGSKSTSLSLLQSINNFFEIRKKFYAVAFLGMNTTSNHWLPAGFQAGLGGHVWLSPKFTLGTELSYLFQPMQYNFMDRASTFTQTSPAIPSAGGYVINYDEHATVKSYNINQVQQFEIPLMLGLHQKNWSFFAGPTINAILPLSYYKMEYATKESKMMTSSVPEFNMHSTQLASQSQDFDARLGLGYILGANYNLNDRFALQFRMNQILTDNASTNIGTKISSELFKNPSFRLGIQYKLTKSKRVMYMMDEQDR